MGARCPLSAACASARWPPLRSRRSAAESKSPTTARHPSVILSHITPCEADRSPGVGMFVSTRRALPSDGDQRAARGMESIVGSGSGVVCCGFRAVGLGRAVDLTGVARARRGADQVRSRDGPQPSVRCASVDGGRRLIPASDRAGMTAPKRTHLVLKCHDDSKCRR